MRSWLAIILWALLLVQPGWVGTAASTGAAGVAVASTHHCPHAHPCNAAPTSAAPDAGHADCGACHGTCNLALFDTRHLHVVVPVAFATALATPPPASHPGDLPERPQWAAFATA